MILDKQALPADGIAHSADSDVLDLGPDKPGPGRPIKMFIQGSADLAGCTGFSVVDGDTSSPSDALITHTCGLAGETVEFELPSDVGRYIKIALAGSTSAGTWSAGVVLPGVQTNK